MHCLDCEDTFRHVELGDILRESVVLDQPVWSAKASHLEWNGAISLHSHQIPSWQELHDEVEVLRVLERVKELDDPRRIRFGQNITFSPDVRELSPVSATFPFTLRYRVQASKTHLVLFEHFILLQCLHGVDLARIGLLYQSDLTKRSFSNYFDGPKVL